jgi:hypothetical protein
MMIYRSNIEFMSIVHLQCYDDDVNLLGSTCNTHTIKKNKEILTDATKETGLQANRET